MYDPGPTRHRRSRACTVQRAGRREGGSAHTDRLSVPPPQTTRKHIHIPHTASSTTGHQDRKPKTNKQLTGNTSRPCSRLEYIYYRHYSSRRVSDSSPDTSRSTRRGPLTRHLSLYYIYNRDRAARDCPRQCRLASSIPTLVLKIPFFRPGWGYLVHPLVRRRQPSSSSHRPPSLAAPARSPGGPSARGRPH